MTLKQIMPSLHEGIKTVKKQLEPIINAMNHCGFIDCHNIVSQLLWQNICHFLI